MSTEFGIQNIPSQSDYSVPKVSSCSIQAQNGQEISRQNIGQKNRLMLDVQVRLP